MGLKDKMMEGMMGNMSKEEKMEMMNKMMDSFFNGMSKEEKSEMMPKMMGENGGGMMGMMKNMMGSKKMEGGDSFNPMDMCKKMMSGISESQKVSTLATPEVRTLFEEWVEQIENEILEKIKDKDNIDIDEISKEFKLSKESSYYFLTKLAQKNKIKIKIEK